MNLKQCVILIILMSTFFRIPTLSFASNPDVREKQLEEALLQQLHSNITGALKSIYKTEYVMIGCTEISNIQQPEAMRDQSEKRSINVDAMNGGKYFELTISLCRVGPKEDNVELYFKNDTAGANYYLVDYKIITGENSRKLTE